MTKLLGHHTGTISTAQLFVFSTGSSTTFYRATAKPVQNHFYMRAVHFYTTNSIKLVNCTYWGAVGIFCTKNDKTSRSPYRHHKYLTTFCLFYREQYNFLHSYSKTSTKPFLHGSGTFLHNQFKKTSQLYLLGSSRNFSTKK